MMTLAQLIHWHTTQGIDAMHRANNAQTFDCKLANQRASDFHREAVELLATFSTSAKD